jgi:hypothetical protein
MRPVGVVLLAPPIYGGLGILDGRKWLVLVQQLQLQGLVQPLDLAGRGR